MSHSAMAVVAYGFIIVFGLLTAGFVGFLKWVEGSRSSTIALSAGAAALAVMTLAATVLTQALG